MVSLEQFVQFFSIAKGVTAIIGGGGKTTLLLFLARELHKTGSVIVTTSTHIFQPKEIPFQKTIQEALSAGQVFAIGTPCENGKITTPKQPFAELTTFADYVLVEADGSKGLPLKAHASHEPVIPTEAKTVLAVVGLSGIGKPIFEVAHRPDLYAAIAAKMLVCPVRQTDLVTPEMAAAVVRQYNGVTGAVLNQADTADRIRYAEEMVHLLPCPTAITSLQQNHLLSLWRNGVCW